MSKFLKILLPVVAAICMAACSSGKGRVIPKGTMAHIYAEMFVADQQIASDWKLKRTADTSLVYEPIFEKYGYTSEDYRASREYYIQDPDRYARILRKSVQILEGEVKELKKEKKMMESLEQVRKSIAVYAPERIHYMTGLNSYSRFVEDSLVFCVDSSGGIFLFDPQDGMDTAYYGPVMRLRDTVVTVTDSADTAIAAPVDSLPFFEFEPAVRQQQISKQVNTGHPRHFERMKNKDLDKK
ncbi:MAG: DUF4296 domain-containing protein [Candidatus Cryptobacteroides sp.]